MEGVTAHDSVTVDTVVVGSGLAGLYAALRAADHGTVLVVTEGRLAESSSYFAQGGVAAAVGIDDNPERHEADTLRVGRGLCRTSAVQLLTDEAPRHIERLAGLGVDFDSIDGVLDLGLEAGHSRRRIAHAGSGATGRIIMDAVITAVHRNDRIRILETTPVSALLMSEGRCTGVQTPTVRIAAHATILATGGAASLFARTTNPPGSRGAGVALAWAAGADITDMEFVQFHPTALMDSGSALDGFLISEAVRGEGAYILDHAGERFMTAEHHDAELAPRDELARAIVARIEQSGAPVYLSLAHLDAATVNERFGAIATRLAAGGFDLARDRIPIAPAAHYTIGGVQTDLFGQSTVAGLRACGEVACTGVHGANRLASNSLLECLVFADRAGAMHDVLASPIPAVHSMEPRGVSGVADQHLSQRLWYSAGVVRCAERLEAFLTEIAEETSPATTVARLIATAALYRTESRGAHFRSDHPTEDNAWCRHVVQRRASAVPVGGPA